MDQTKSGVRCHTCRNFLVSPALYCCSKKRLYCRECRKYTCQKCNKHPDKTAYLRCEFKHSDPNISACDCRIFCNICTRAYSPCIICKQNIVSLLSDRPISTQLKPIEISCVTCKRSEKDCLCRCPRCNQKACRCLSNSKSIPKPAAVLLEKCAQCFRQNPAQSMFCNSFCGHFLCLNCYKKGKPRVCNYLACKCPFDEETASMFFPACQGCGHEFLKTDPAAQNLCDKCVSFKNSQSQGLKQKSQQAATMKPDSDQMSNSILKPEQNTTGQKSSLHGSRVQRSSDKKPVEPLGTKNKPIRNNFLTVESALGNNGALSKSIERSANKTPSKLPPKPTEYKTPQKQKDIVIQDLSNGPSAQLANSRHLTQNKSLTDSRYTNPMKASMTSVGSNFGVPSECTHCGLTLEHKYLINSSCELRHKLCRYCVLIRKGLPCEACQEQEDDQLKKIYLYQEVKKENKQEYVVRGAKNKKACGHCGVILNQDKLIKYKQKQYCGWCCVKFVK